MEFILVSYNGEKVQLDSKFILGRWIGMSKLTHPLLKACIYLNLELFHLKGNPKFSCFFFSPLVGDGEVGGCGLVSDVVHGIGILGQWKSVGPLWLLPF